MLVQWNSKKLGRFMYTEKHFSTLNDANTSLNEFQSSTQTYLALLNFISQLMR